MRKQWDKFSVTKNQFVVVQFKKRKIKLPFVETFGDVKINQPLILKDDYGRVEIAVNMGNFAEIYGIKIGDKCIIKKL
ncbi:SAM-dependent chlorinase/fluorinase [Candidatus Peregrinibacteria bacterium]|nr:SAM-dependent chlorinase/fluorinase [Candidatus Peregrinibacteria bacterium]